MRASAARTAVKMKARVNKMRLGTLFPNWRIHSIIESQYWDLDIDLLNAASFFKIRNLIVNEQSESCKKGKVELYQISEFIARDILALQKATQNGSKLFDLEYLQFEACIWPFRHALNEGDLGRTHDWIVNGFSDEISRAVERSYFPQRAEAFMTADDNWVAELRTEALLDWLPKFYYYCFRCAALFEFASSIFLQAAVFLTGQPLTDLRQVEGICMMLNWAAVYQMPIAQPLTSQLEKLFYAPGLPTQARVRVAVLFSTNAGRFSSQSPRHWAQWALTNGTGYLGSHEPFQLLLTLIEKSEDWAHIRRDVMQAAETYAADIKRSQSLPTSFIAAIDQRSGILHPAAFVLHKFGLSADLLEVLLRWYGIEEKQRAQEGSPFYLPDPQRRSWVSRP